MVFIVLFYVDCLYSDLIGVIGCDNVVFVYFVKFLEYNEKMVDKELEV